MGGDQPKIDLVDELHFADQLTVAIDEQRFGFFPDAELVIAIVCPLGTDHQAAAATLENYLTQFGYSTHHVRLTNEFLPLCETFSVPYNLPVSRLEQAKYKIEIGNQLRRKVGSMDFFARVAASVIAAKRQKNISQTPGASQEPEKLPQTAHIISTVKRPEEVDLLRRIYGTGFFVIGLTSTAASRASYFKERGIDATSAQKLRDTDAAEDKEEGQRTRETFQLSDVFISMEDYKAQIARFLDLIFGDPRITPNLEEHAMFLAYAASLRSGDLSRQVGASLMDEYGDSIAVGCNEVPKHGGGIYLPGPGSQRDLERGNDSNETAKLQLVERVMLAIGQPNFPLDQAKKLLKPTGLLDLTEYGRTVHAEMEALLACARTGRSPRGATLYTTTYPCHNCCRHIIAAGIAKVVYIEPYPKSKAQDLHRDAISEADEPEHGKIPFKPFIGVGPRRYFDLFSMKLSTGYEIERKSSGEVKAWDRATAKPRLQMQPNSYLQRELLVFQELSDIIQAKGSND